MQQIIDIDGDNGKSFLEQVKKCFPVKRFSETVKEVVRITDLTEYPFLGDVVTESTLKEFGAVVESVEIGNYGRKSGWSSNGDGKTFRIVIHLGNPEAYYYNDHVYAVTAGSGFILSPWGPAGIFVRNDPVQVFGHEGVQKVVPKIRPRNYLRTTLVYNVSVDLTKMNDGDGVDSGDASEDNQEGGEDSQESVNGDGNQ